MPEFAELNPGWGENEYRGVFLWSKISGYETKKQVLKVEKKVTKWDDCLVVLCRNYLLAYPCGKDGSVKNDEAPRYFIRLDQSSVSRLSVREDLSGMWPKKEQVQYGMAVEPDANPAEGGFYVKFDSNPDMGAWYDLVYKEIPVKKKQARELHKWGRPLAELTKVVKMPPRIETTTPGDRAKEWIEKMQQYRRLLREWKPMMKVMTNFCELYHEQSKTYLDWFASVSGKGFEDNIEQAEEEQLAFWKNQFLDIAKVKDKIGKATEVSFFKEDFEPTIQFCKDQLLMLKAFNFYRGSILNKSDGHEYSQVEAKLMQLAKFLSAFPSAGQVNMCEGFRKAMMKVGPEIWEFEAMPEVAENHVEFRNKTDPQQCKPFFTVGGFEMISADWGSVLWNRTSWVWYHPQLPYTIRYNYKRAEQLFTFHAVKGEPKDGQYAVMPSWKWNGKNGLQPVLSASVALDPAIKGNFASVVYQGSCPLPVVMLAAMIKHIRFTTAHHFGYE